MNSTIQERVAAGVAWPDEKDPVWADRVDLAQFEMESSCRCVLGQVFKGLGATSGFRWAEMAFEEIAERSEDLGFDVRSTDLLEGRIEYSDLEEAWIAVIQERHAS